MAHGLRCHICGTEKWDCYAPAYDFGGRYDGRATYKHWCPRTGGEVFKRVGSDPGDKHNDGDTRGYLSRPVR